MLEFLEHHLRLYLPELLCSSVDGDPATAHVFERTVQLSQHDMIGAVSVPLQLTFVLKVANGGKLNSHLWFLIGFCRQLQPKYFLVCRLLMRLVVVVSLDADTLTYYVGVCVVHSWWM